MTTKPSLITIHTLQQQHRALFLDAYGVLIHHQGAYPGAAAWIDAMNAEAYPYCIVTNDASNTAESAAAKYQRFGLAIDATCVVTACSLLQALFAERGWAGKRCIVMGTTHTETHVTQAGGTIVPSDTNENIDILVVGDEAGYPLLETIDNVLSQLFRHFDAGREVHLLLPNPDLIYPAGPARYGITSGSIALIFEEALRLRYGRAIQFERLGKPYPTIFAQGIKRLRALHPSLHDIQASEVAMVGDQHRTDVLGANRFGLTSVLVGQGVSQQEDPTHTAEHQPNYRMDGLSITT